MPRKDTDFIIIHCSATGPNHDVDIKEIDHWHRSQGWRMVGYHFLIKRDGTAQQGRGLMDGGAHAGKEYNNRSIGICLAGGVAADGKTPEANYTSAQWSSLAALTRDMRREFPSAEVIGHNEISDKACPCFNVREWWAIQE